MPRIQWDSNPLCPLRLIGYGKSLPLPLFLVYINDIVKDIHFTIRLFADYTSLYIIVKDLLRAAHQLNSDLAKLHLWATKWLVSFNPSKSESIIFSRKQIKRFHPPIEMNQKQISEVNSHKHLGLIFFE